MTAAAVPAPKTPEPPRAGPQSAPIPGVATAPAIDPIAYTEDAVAFSQKTLDALATPVDPELVEERAVKEGSDAKLLFVPWVHYQAVLLKAFGPGGYRLVPRGVPRTEGNVITWHGALFVRAPGDTKFQFIKEAKGECKVTGAMTAGNLAEGAQSDCLVKCCKGLGIFMELFDPRWRRAWEAKYRPQHQREVRAAQWPAARAGAAPSAAPSSPASSGPSSTPPASPLPPTVDAAGPAPSPSPSAPSANVPSDPDPGAAATTEQKEALKGAIRGLAWKVGYARIWFSGLFGDLFKQGDPLEKLTQRQADTAYYLVLAHGKPLYDKLLEDERAKGNVL